MSESNEQRFVKQPPSTRLECPLCMLIVPLDPDESIYKSCCGKVICRGCAYASTIKQSEPKRSQSGGLETAPCAFCRAEAPEDYKEYVHQLESRAKKDDVMALYNLGHLYMDGRKGLPRSRKKAIELYQRGHELGSPDATYCLAYMYDKRIYPMEGDPKKEKEFMEEAARRGNVDAIYQLARFAHEEGEGEEAAKHAMAAAKAGDDTSLGHVKEYFKYGFVSKDEFAATLRENQAANDAVKSSDREMAKHFRPFR